MNQLKRIQHVLTFDPVNPSDYNEKPFIVHYWSQYCVQSMYEKYLIKVRDKIFNFLIIFSRLWVCVRYKWGCWKQWIVKRSNFLVVDRVCMEPASTLPLLQFIVATPRHRHKSVVLNHKLYSMLMVNFCYSRRWASRNFDGKFVCKFFFYQHKICRYF